MGVVVPFSPQRSRVRVLARVGHVDDEDAAAAAGDDELHRLGLAQILLQVHLVRWNVEEIASLQVILVL